ncbi:MAG: AsmA-like C-terminal region-containing protein [Chitinophagaceae bacterium]
MKKALKITLWTAGIIVALFLIGLSAAYWYIARNKEQIRLFVQQEFSNNYNGTLQIGSIEPDVWQQFPSVSLGLHDVVIRDTAWPKHHTDFLNVKHLYLKLAFWPLLKGNVAVDKLLLQDGTMNLFVAADSSSNKSIFQRKKVKKKKKGKASFDVNVMTLRNFHFTFRNAPYKKYFDFRIPELNGRIHSIDQVFHFQTQAKVQVKSFAFNTDKGSYFKDQNITFELAFTFNPKRNLLQVKNQEFVIGDQRLRMNGDFFTAKADNWFSTDIEGKNINYRTGLSWVPPTVYNSLKGFIFERPVSFRMHIEGRLKDQRIPLVALSADFTNNTLDSKFGKFDSLSFHLSYVNGSKKDSLYGDEYSFLKLTRLKAQFAGIPITADTTTVVNLKCSRIKTHVRSSFPVKKLNNVFGRESFIFGEGNAQIDLHYEGGMKKDSKYPLNISAYVDLRQIEMTYRPRNLHFHKCNVRLQVLNNDIKVVESELNTERSQVFIAAYSRDFLSLYREHPENILIEAQVRSRHIDLNEFQSFLQSRPQAVRQPKKSSGNGDTPDFLDEALDLSRTHLTVAVDKVTFKRFDARNIKGDLLLLSNGIELRNASLEHADGNLSMSGALHNTDARRPDFSINAKVEHTSIGKLLYAFDNFGQQSFHPENIRGTIDVTSHLEGQLDDSNAIVGSSLRGTATFDIRHGALVNFRPLLKMGRLLFRKERLEQVNFERIHNTFTIRGNEIDIPPMWVNTDLIDMQIQGVYSLGIGTDILLEIPLFRFSKKDIAEDPQLSQSKGFRLYIQAKDDEKGEMHFKPKLRNTDISKENQERKRLKELRKKRKEN